MTPGRARIGTSGYQYDHWRGAFYPENLPKKRWFEHYRTCFDTVEINNTFYRLPDASVFDRWRDAAPERFVFVLKFSRYGSHTKCLRDPSNTVAAFLERAERLEDRLGPILVQLKPSWSRNVERLERFLDAAPDARRWALEFRHPSWLCDEVFDVLRRHNAALCIHDMIEDHPRAVTADWVYLRFHGDRYAGSYSPQCLSSAADDIAGYVKSGLDVYAYFNNDAEGHAVRNALDLKRRVRARGVGE
jgi:uncharacterized protein YecE (DUF72 family)